jgi:sporulation protein YlmC with PRC-barrel domain
MTPATGPQTPPDAPRFRRAGQTPYDLVLRLLDHQVVGSDGQLIGKVDGLELVRDGDELWVTGLGVGLAALADRMPGRLGDWMAAVWRRFHPKQHPLPTIVPITHVTSIGSSVALDQEASEALARTLGIELWLREHVVSRIPGATGGGEDREEGSGAPPSNESDRRELDPRPDGMSITSLLGLPVEDEHGQPLGRVWEIGAVGAPGDTRQGPLRVTHVRAARHRFAIDLGYGSDDQQGPALIEGPARLSQRRDRTIAISDVDLESLDQGVVTLRRSESGH